MAIFHGPRQRDAFDTPRRPRRALGNFSISNCGGCLLYGLKFMDIVGRTVRDAVPSVSFRLLIPERCKEAAAQ